MVAVWAAESSAQDFFGVIHGCAHGVFQTVSPSTVPIIIMLLAHPARSEGVAHQ